MAGEIVTLRRIPEERLLRALDAAQDLAEEQVRLVLLAALAALGRGGLSALASRLAVEGQTQLAITLLDWSRFDAELARLVPLLEYLAGRGAWLASMMTSRQGIPESEAIARSASRWLERHVASELLPMIRARTRLGASRMLAHAFAGRLGVGADPNQRVLDRRLRARLVDLVGVDEVGADALRRLLDRLVGKGLAPKVIERHVAARARKLLTHRVATIARTEASWAVNNGMVEHWRMLVGSGALDPQRYVQEWVTRGARACQQCAPFDGATCPIDGHVFVALNGARSGGAPLHPWCYCTRRLVRRRVSLPTAA